jgi:2-polyprenyl-3-methyl-5-hydroxy-6-metoxy-1,4-benzoquinol methylase
MADPRTGVQTFYDNLSSWYHGIYADWDTSISRQAAQLDAIIRQRGLLSDPEVLDVSCGIGTQSLGLAALGYRVTASDISSKSVQRLRTEARRRNLTIATRVADLRELWQAHRTQFDVVLSCDNAIPHLLTEKQILAAFTQMRRCTVPSGMCIVSVRDYQKERTKGVQFKPYGIRTIRGARTVLFQVWEFRGKRYTVSLHAVTLTPTGGLRSKVLQTEYCAISIPALMQLMRQAGFMGVRRLDDAFFQPVIVGRRA